MADEEAKVWRLAYDCGRMGDIESVFVATEKYVKDMAGHAYYLGEVLGEHSEIEIDVEEQDFECLSSDPAVVAWVEERGPFGYDFVTLYHDVEECGELDEDRCDDYED